MLDLHQKVAVDSAQEDSCTQKAQKALPRHHTSSCPVLSPLILYVPPENIGSHLCVHLLLPVIQVDTALPQQHLLAAGDGEHADVNLELLPQQLTLYGGDRD